MISSNLVALELDNGGATIEVLQLLCMSAVQELHSMCHNSNIDAYDILSAAFHLGPKCPDTLFVVVCLPLACFWELYAASHVSQQH